MNTTDTPRPKPGSAEKAALSALQQAIFADLLPDYADGRLDDDPVSKAEIEKLLNSNAHARAFLSEYRAASALVETAAAAAPQSRRPETYTEQFRREHGTPQQEAPASWRGKLSGLLGLCDDALGQPALALLTSSPHSSRTWKLGLAGLGLADQERRSHLPWVGDAVQISLSCGRTGKLAYFAYAEPSAEREGSSAGRLRVTLRTQDGTSSKVCLTKGEPKKQFKGPLLPADPMLVHFEISVE